MATITLKINKELKKQIEKTAKLHARSVNSWLKHLCQDNVYKPMVTSLDMPGGFGIVNMSENDKIVKKEKKG